MILAERLHKNRSITLNLDAISYKQALSMGLFQCLALVPGFSRMGSALSGGLLVGMNHKTASGFSFIMAVPIMVAASGKDLMESWDSLSMGDVALFVTGFITAFIVALIAIWSFLKLIPRIKLIPLALYRFVLALTFWLFIL